MQKTTQRPLKENSRRDVKGAVADLSVYRSYFLSETQSYFIKKLFLIKKMTCFSSKVETSHFL